MKTLVKTILSLLLLMSFSFGVTSCKKEEQRGAMTVKMTDAPADYLKVYVEVIGMQVHSEANGWMHLPVNAGIYNLLDLQNNASVILSSNAQLPAGKINQMRLILGTNNSLVTIQGTYDLKVPGGDETGLKINVNETIMPNHTVVILLDFDAAASVVDKGNGTYSLKPVISVKSVTQI